MSKTEKIIELKELLDSGLISSDDFERLKKQIFEEPEKVSFEIKKIKQVDILDNVRQKRNIFYDSIKKCTKCGSDNKLENQICSVCKSDFPIVESKTEQKNYIENKKSDYKFYIFGILGFVLLFFGVSYFINNHNDKEQKESEVPTAFDSISVEPVPTVSVEENSDKMLDVLIQNEIEKWKNELISQKKYNYPCREVDEEITLEITAEWFQKYYDGPILSISPDIKILKYDINNDNFFDALCYFEPDNCGSANGTSGQGSEEAMLVYSSKNDKYLTKYNLTNLIEENIKLKFGDDQVRSVLIKYNNFNLNIEGSYILYLVNDAGCCPSINGFFSFDLKNSKLNEISKFQNN